MRIINTEKEGTKRKRGRPPKRKAAEELQAVIDAYFNTCAGTLLTKHDDAAGEDIPVLDKNMQPVYTGVTAPTITGLALALGFTGRQALMNHHEEDEAVNEVMARAKSRVEEYAETCLYDKDTRQGAKFALMNNFAGWKEKPAEEEEIPEGFMVEIHIVE